MNAYSEDFLRQEGILEESEKTISKTSIVLSPNVQEFGYMFADDSPDNIKCEIDKLRLYMQKRGFAPLIYPVEIRRDIRYGHCVAIAVYAIGGYIGTELAKLVELIKSLQELEKLQKLAKKLNPEFSPKQ